MPSVNAAVRSIPANADMQANGIYQASGPGHISALISSGTRKSPARVNASGSTIFGVVDYDEANLTGLGFSEVKTDGTFSFLSAPLKGNMNRPLQRTIVSYVRKNEMISLGTDYYDGVVVVKKDIGTGESTITPVSSEYFPNYQNCMYAYDAENDRLLGYVYDGTNLYFGYAPGDAPGNYTPTGTFDMTTIPKEGLGVVASAYNAVDDKFILFFSSRHGAGIYEADPVNGDFSHVGYCPVPSEFTTGACFSPYDNAYVFAVCNSTGCSLQLLDKDTFEIISQTDYPSLIEFSNLTCADGRKILGSAPGEASIVDISFPEGALFGSISFRLASVSHNGTPILGNIDWVLLADGKEVKRGTAPAASTVEVDVPLLEEGYHDFKFRQSLGGNYGPDLKTTLFIGNDTPLAPESVTLSPTTISWTPVTAGIRGAYVNPEEVTYNVYLNDELIASGIKATSCGTRLGPDTSMALFTAAVEAVFDSKVSEKRYSNDITYGQPVSLPFYLLPQEKEQNLFTIYDPDNTDPFYYYGGPHAAYGPVSAMWAYTRNCGSNAYIFLPPMKFDDPEAVYEYAAEMFRSNKNFQESFELVLCTKPDPASRVKTLIAEKSPYLIEKPEDDHKNIIEKASFTVPAAGVYYIGIHPTSENGERIGFCNFNVRKSENLSSSSPDLVTGLKAVPADKGVLSAIVSFNMPLAKANGETFDAATPLTARIQADGCEPVTVSGTPGEAVSASVSTLQGDNNIIVTPFDGDTEGISANMTIYTGVYIPAEPVNFKASMSADNLTATLSWDPPVRSITIGNYGGYVAPTGVTYYLCRKTAGNSWEPTSLIGTDVLTCDIRIPENTPQAVAEFGILAENAAGRSNVVAVCQSVVGKLRQLPSDNNFYLGENVQPIVNYSDMSFPFLGDPKQFFPAFATDDNLNAFFTYAFAKVVDAWFTLPRFSSVGVEHAAIELYIYGGSCESFSVCATAHGMDGPPQVIATFPASSFDTTGPQRIRVELPAAFQNKGWVEPSIRYTATPPSESFILYGFRYIDNLANDFGVTRLADNTIARIGEEARFTASVINFGHQERRFPGAMWTLTDADGQTVASVEIPAASETTPPDGSVSHSISFTPNVEQIGDLTLSYTINPGDEKASNDALTVKVPVTVGSRPAVTDLRADAITSDAVSLQWSAPVGADTAESFEDEEPFVLDEESDIVGPFTRIDGDAEMTLTVNGLKDQPYAGLPASFVVYSQSGIEEIMGESVFKAYTGDRFLVAFCPGTADATQPQADDWLISPLITPSTSVSFFAKPLTFELGAETIQILYSSETARPSKFKLLKEIEIKGDAAETPLYQEYSALLPADAKYFAIRYTSQNRGAIFIDDIRFTSADSRPDVSNYEIYRDGQKLAATPDAATLHTDKTVTADSPYTYTVVPVLPDGTKGLESNRLSIRTTAIGGITEGNRTILARDGIIEIRGYEGDHATITATDGKTIFSGICDGPLTRIKVTSGIYIVKVGRTTLKLIVS